MAEWSYLPKELLELIARRLTTFIDILRFRSVCSSWRSSVSYPPHRLPTRFPIFPKDGNRTSGFPDLGFFYLSKRVIFRLGLPENPRRNSVTSSEGGWLIKLEEVVPDMLHLLNPLSEAQIQPLPATFPKILDLLEFRVTELGQEYALIYSDYRLGEAGYMYRRKVAVSSSPASSADDDYMLMTIHDSGNLVLFRSEDQTWTIIEDVVLSYVDVIHYKGEFYAVDCTGRAVVVGPSLKVTEIASPVVGGNKKCLVESDGELLLIDRGHDDAHCYDDEFYLFLIQFKVFKLDRREKKWVKVNCLGDHVLFLSENCSFSASACDFSGIQGNCIYFSEKNLCGSNREGDGGFKDDYKICLFNLDDGSIGPLASFPGYSQLFWPPPAWVTPTTLEQRWNESQCPNLVKQRRFQ